MQKIKPETLRVLRARKGWSQEELANKARLDKQTIWRIEKGKHRSVAKSFEG